jgi:predicted AAA+ superfamily ATPase
MIERELLKLLSQRVQQVPVVALIGSRQVGKTTLAHCLKSNKPTHYLDLERPSDVAKLADPELYLSRHAGSLVILDEIQRVPNLFPVLRSLVDERRRNGEKAAQFLLLGSASPELLQQSSETLAGRISFMELTPFNLTEILKTSKSVEWHWFRGGYPDSFLAEEDSVAVQWCEDFIASSVERYIPQLGGTLPSMQLRRLCSMLAHQQGSTLNLSSLANSLAIDGKTVRRYIDLLESLFVVRSLRAWSRNAGKRLVKSPKVYVRDSGILHTLAGLHSLEQVLGHPICGHSWEGYCVEQILGKLPFGYTASYYRTSAGAEIDLVLETPQGSIVAIEIKRSLSPKLTASFRESMKTIEAKKGFYIMPHGDAFPLSELVEAMSLTDFLQRDF